MWAKLKSWLGGTEQTPLIISPELLAAVEPYLPCLDFVADGDRQRLHELARQFLLEKEMAGGNDFQPTDSTRLAIALQACLPILNLGLDWYREFVGIIVYPGSFIAPRTRVDEIGVQHEYQDILAGEAWQGGPVVLGWFDDPTQFPGVNPVIHEFAHKLDMLDGPVDGMPPLPPDMPRSEWQEAFQTAYKDFRRRVRVAEMRGVELELDPYAAESPGEFFAVMTEAFFETPVLLREEYPAVYRQLQLFYRQDPASAEQALMDAQAATLAAPEGGHP